MSLIGESPRQPLGREEPGFACLFSAHIRNLLLRDSEDPTFEGGSFAFMVAQRWIEIAIEDACLRRLTEPSRNAIRVLLVARSLLSWESVS